MTRPIRVIVVDDSPFVCQLLTSYLESSADIHVVGTALNGMNAVEIIKQKKPDTVTLDLDMPEMNGLETLERIMYDCPTPVVLVSGVSHQAAELTLRALEIGAVDFIFKYTPGEDTNPEVLQQEVIAKVKAASRIKVIRSIRLGHGQDGNASPEHVPTAPPATPSVDEPVVAKAYGAATLPSDGVVVIGASTGGPIALRELLANLPANFPTAIVIVQHMPPTFTRVLAAQLNRHVPLRVKEAEAGDHLKPGVVFVVPGDFHLLVSADYCVEINQGPEINGHRPSVDVTMQSVAQMYGAQARGVILSGMGEDGAMGMVYINARGGKTFAQSPDTCVVDGMPQRAIEKGVVDHVGAPVEIAQMLKLEFARVSEELG